MMMKSGSNELALLRPFMIVVILVLAIGSFGLFFFPEWTVERWPWPLAAFHTRFLGAVYLSEFSAVAILLFRNRWAPARLSLPVAVSFTFFVSVASFIHINTFDFTRRGVWLWFILYVVSFFISLLLLWKYQRAPEDAQTVPSFWQAILSIQTFFFGLYGVGLFITPETFGGFWPWKIDTFHGNIYSSVFISGALGSWLVSRNAARVELFTQGLSQVILGLFAILGLFIVDTRVNRVDWANLGVYLWLGMFIILALIGLGLIRLCLRR